MENKAKMVNWEKISVLVAALAVMITLWSSLHQTQRDMADIRERIARIEVKIENIEEKSRWESRRTGTEREQEMGLFYLFLVCMAGFWWLNRDEIREEVERDEEPY